MTPPVERSPAELLAECEAAIEGTDYARIQIAHRDVRELQARCPHALSYPLKGAVEMCVRCKALLIHGKAIS